MNEMLINALYIVELIWCVIGAIYVHRQSAAIKKELRAKIQSHHCFTDKEMYNSKKNS